MAEQHVRKTAMISSTSLDLPEHRKEVMDACLRQDIFPKAMEHLPARDARRRPGVAGDGGSGRHLHRYLRLALRPYS